MPKEYIERSSLLWFLEDLHDDNDWLVNQYNADWIWSWIDSQPAADVVEVVHGRWLGTHDGWYYSYSCSECGAEALTKEETMHDQVCSAYCPNCGAKMDGERK